MMEWKNQEKNKKKMFYKSYNNIIFVWYAKYHV